MGGCGFHFTLTLKWNLIIAPAFKSKRSVLVSITLLVRHIVLVSKPIDQQIHFVY